VLRLQERSGKARAVPEGCGPSATSRPLMHIAAIIW
jgi:hypothetical protein